MFLSSYTGNTVISCIYPFNFMKCPMLSVLKMRIVSMSTLPDIKVAIIYFIWYAFVSPITYKLFFFFFKHAIFR